METVERNEFLSEDPADRVFVLQFSGTVVTERDETVGSEVAVPPVLAEDDVL